MKELVILLLSLTIVLDVKASYFLEDFLNYIQEKGYYDIIVQLKYYYGNDIAIDFCKQLVQNSNCDLFIRIYIPQRTRGENEEIPSLDSIIFYPDNYEIYKGREVEFFNWIKKMEIQYNID